MTTDLDLTKFKALSFDCYETLIDWETGLLAVLAPWAREQGLDVSDADLLLAYADEEAAVQREAPSTLYPDVLATAFRRTGEKLGAPVSDEWAERLGDSVPDWPAFPDSPDALARLARRYKLIILSNVHRAGFAGSNERLRGDFAAIITAEDVGAYKPAENHFRALDATLPDLGVDRGELLHVAQSLFHDHVPAKREGLPSVWINRRHDRPGWGATPEPSEEWSFALEFNSMADFADAVEGAFAARESAPNMSERNVAVARRWIELFNGRDDVDEFLSLHGPEVELQTPGGPRLRGHDQVRDWFEAGYENVKPRILPERFVAEGDTVVGLGRIELRWIESGEVAHEGESAGAYWFRDGKIIAWQPFETHAAALEETGLEE